MKCMRLALAKHTDRVGNGEAAVAHPTVYMGRGEFFRQE